MKPGNGETRFTLPGSYTSVYQSNRITNGTFQGFGLIHTKIFVAIVKSLQEAIKAEMNGLDWQQLNLFEEVTQESIQVRINLKEITAPNHYPNAVEAAKELMGLVVKLKKNSAPNGYISFRTLLAGVDEPVKLDGKKVLIIHVLKVVATEIILIDKNKEGAAINFTKYFYEIAMSTKSKFTIRLYILISSWKNKGGFYISLNELRKTLDIKEHEYKNFAKFKEKVLIPAQKELEKIGDCWFNSSCHEFENRAGKKVIGLNFKVQTKQTEEKNKQKTDHLRQMLTLHAGFNKDQLLSLKPVFNQTHLIDEIIVKAVYLISKKEDANGQKIDNKIAFISKSLLSEFAWEKNIL